jgi:hypothetical protein
MPQLVPVDNDPFAGTLPDASQFDANGHVPQPLYVPTPTHQPIVAQQPELVAPDPITAYHGSPYNFDQFSADKIGSGEGTQFEGRGLYFTDKPGVTELYTNSGGSHTGRGIAKGYLEQHGGSPEDRERAAQVIESSANSGAPQYQEAASLLRDQNWQPANSTYQVKLHIDKNNLIDLDASASGQPQAIKDIISRNGIEISPNFENGQTTGRDVLHQVNGHFSQEFLDAHEAAGNDIFSASPTAMAEHARQRMIEEGIHGTRYLNGHVNDGGATNYAIFDPKHIEITHKNGNPIKLTPVEHDPFAASPSESGLKTEAPSVNYPGMKSSALSDSELQTLASKLPSDVYLHNSPNSEIDFGNGGGNYGGAFFVQRKEPYGQQQYGPNVHAFQMKGNILHVADEKMEQEVRHWLEQTDKRGHLPEAYEDLIHRQHGGDYAAAASQMADELRNVNLIDTEHSLVDMGEHLSSAGYHGVKTNDAALLFDPASALQSVKP